MKVRTSRCYMVDFAASDSRSVKAHLEGRSPRAACYAMFSALAPYLGRGDSASADFVVVSRFFFRRRKQITHAVQAAKFITTAVLGLVAGCGLFFYLKL